MDAATVRTPFAVLPRRIWVVGPSGSGKSTVAARLASQVGVEPTHMDDLFWKPNWQKSAHDELDSRIAPVVARDAWVIDGNYTAVRRRHVDRVQLYVWLDLSIHITVRRVVCRALDRALRHEPICNGNYESLWTTLTSRKSIVLWAYQSHARVRSQYAAELADQPHVRLRTPREVEAWLRRPSLRNA